MPHFPSPLLSAGLFSPSDMGLPEMIIIFVLILIFFGPKRLPQLSKAIGKAIHDFKRGLNNIQDDIDQAGDAEELKAKAQARAAADAPSVPPAQNSAPEAAPAPPSQPDAEKPAGTP